MSCVPTYCLSVTPDGGYDPTRSVGGSGYTTDFSVYNWGAADFVEFSCSSTGGVTCTSLSNDGQNMTAGQTITVTATYSVGSSGGTVVLDALGHSPAHDTGYKSVDTPPNLSLVTPTLATADTAKVFSRTPLIIANYSNNDAAIDTTSLVVVLGTDTVTSLVRANSRLMEWEIDTSRALAPGTNRNLTIKVCNVAAGCNTHTWHLLLDNSGAPLVSFTGMPLEAQGRHFSAPFGPGISVSGGEVETGFSVPSFTSMNTGRSTGFVYSTRQAYPRALVNTDIELTWPAGTPDSIKATLIDGSTRMDSLKVNSPSCTGGNGHRCRITLQGDFSGTTGTEAVRKWLKVEVKVTSSGTTKTTTDSVEVVLVDRRGSPYGRGWYASGQLMLFTAGNDKVLVAPDGAATVYRGSGGTWISPPGDFSTITKNSGINVISYRDGSSVNFDTLGRVTTYVDAHNNWTQFTYKSGTTESEEWIRDPIGHYFHVTYSGSTITVTDTLSSFRRSVLTLNGSNQVTYDSIASPNARPAKTTYSYTSVGSNNANVLATRADAQGNTTTISYDARNRPTQATLPAVLPETGGSTQSPVITYRAAEQRGLDTLISVDSGYVRMVDPLGNWTRSTLNRWGEASRSWDALGTLARATYTAEGFVAWQEGKTADSTRVYFAYDKLGRRARSYRYRAAGDIVQLDTLLYDASNNVIRHKNALGQHDSMAYGGFGHTHDLLGSWTPSGEHTTYAYLSNGQTDSVRVPSMGTTHFSYDTVYKNTKYVVEAGTTTESNIYDGFGRLSETDRLLKVRRSHDTTFMQWRRRRTWYNDLNQVDSVRVEHTADCDSPCGSASWPSSTDTSNWSQAKYLYDALGRDTARVSTRGTRTRYVYDVLGRLRMRYPFADSSAVVDSFRYDLAGNARYQWTRRGTLIGHSFDSRNRDTLTSVPGIGDIKHVFGGPNDELTMAWVNSYVDSIGGVSPEVHWGYSQAGLVLADTALQGNRVSTHVYDRYQRDSVETDVNGTWLMRYDATRGMLDTVISPFGDTLRWAPDSLWRPIGPYIKNGTTAGYSLAEVYDSLLKMTSFTSTQSVTLGQLVEHEAEDDKGVNFFPYWTEQHGSGGTSVTMADTLAHDGWDRVTVATYVKDGVQVAQQTISFDREGNISIAGQSRTYDGETQRMLVRGDSYSYDRAGNLTTDSGVGAVWKYTYDPLDRLIAVRYNGTVIARYAYDVLGRRIVKRVYNAGPNGATVTYTRMIYGGGQVAAEADSSGTLTLGYTWSVGTDNLVAVHKYGSGSGDWYAIEDGIHSVRGLSKRDGTWAASYRYKIYGAQMDSSGTAPFDLHYRWSGRERDAETGLYFFRSRMYDPTSQRFTQEDPSGFEGGPNLYAYGSGDPTTGRDPSGLSQNNETIGTQPDRALPSCMADGDIDNCMRSGGNGGGEDPWAALDAQRERDDVMNLSWEDYTRAYGNAVRSGAYAAFPKVNRLEQGDFEAVKNAIADLAELGARAPYPSENSLAVTGLTGILKAGRIGMDEMDIAAGERLGHEIGAEENGGSIVVGDNFMGAGSRPHAQAFMLAHEFGHVIHGGSEPWADHFAVRATGLPQYCGYAVSHCEQYFRSIQ